MARNIMLRHEPFANVVNRFFNDTSYRPLTREWATAWGLGSRLPLDIYEDNDGYTFVAVTPGLSTDEISIEAQGNVVKISGETVAPAISAEENVTTLRHEIGYGKFSRSFELPEEIQGGKIEAKLEKGLLVVSIPKAEEAKPRTVKITTK